METTEQKTNRLIVEWLNEEAYCAHGEYDCSVAGSLMDYLKENGIVFILNK